MDSNPLFEEVQMGCAVGTTLSRKVYDSPEELDLIRKAKQGDGSAFGALHRLHHTRVLLAIMKIIQEPDTAEWVANKAMLDIWNGLPKFQESSKFSTWVTTVARNAALMHLRKEKKRQCEVSLDGCLPDEESSNAHYAERWVATRDLVVEGIADRLLLERALEQVPVRFQKLLRMRIWDDLSMEEIRVRMSESEPELAIMASVKSRILRGRRMLKRQVKMLSHNEVMS